MKITNSGWSISTGASLVTALAGIPWWAMVLMVGVVLGSTYGAVYVLTRNPRVRHIHTFLITWEAAEEPDKPPPKARRS